MGPARADPRRAPEVVGRVILDVWMYLTLAEILRDWQDIRRHLGRRRGFWEYLLEG